MTPRLALLTLLVLASCAGRVGYESQAPMDPDARFARFLREGHLARLDRDPELRRREGLPPLGRFPDLSDDERAEERALVRRELEQLTAFSPATLGAAHRLEHRLLTIHLLARLERLDWLDHAPITLPGEGVLAELRARLLAATPWETEGDALAWIEAVQAGGAWMLAAREVLRDREGRGLLPTRRALELATEDAARLVPGDQFHAHLDRGLSNLTLEPLRRDDLRRRAAASLEEDLAPALEAWHATLEDLSQRSSGDTGAWSRPEGEDWYAHLVAQGTSLPLSANALHQIARQEVDRVQAAMRPRLGQVDHPGSVAGFLNLLRTDERFQLDAEATSARMARALDTATARLGEFVADPPELRLTELAPPEGSSAPQLLAWALERGIPGQALREGWERAAERLPAPAWQEGWDLYVLAVALELGWTEDPYEEVALLDRELWHAALLVADTGLHHERWTPNQAIDYLVTTTATEHGVATAAVDELLLRPGSAAPAVVGNVRLQELQRRSRRRLGDRFDLGRFHRLLLGLGPVPMNVLEEQVAAWESRTLRRPTE